MRRRNLLTSSSELNWRRNGNPLRVRIPATSTFRRLIVVFSVRVHQTSCRRGNRNPILSWIWASQIEGSLGTLPQVCLHKSEVNCKFELIVIVTCASLKIDNQVHVPSSNRLIKGFTASFEALRVQQRRNIAQQAFELHSISRGLHIFLRSE